MLRDDTSSCVNIFFLRWCLLIHFLFHFIRCPSTAIFPSSCLKKYPSTYPSLLLPYKVSLHTPFPHGLCPSQPCLTIPLFYLPSPSSQLLFLPSRPPPSHCRGSRSITHQTLTIPTFQMLPDHPCAVQPLYKMLTNPARSIHSTTFFLAGSTYVS